MTNADKFFRNATDGQIARFMAASQAEVLEKAGRAVGYPGTLVKPADIAESEKSWLEWLKKEVSK